jgi:SCY1-like protein 3
MVSSSWDNGWSEEDKDFQKSPQNTLSKYRTKGAAPRMNGASVGGLGEEFTIEVKRRPDRDPELDLFADMVPDIVMSSPTLVLPVDGGFTDCGKVTAGLHGGPTQPDASVTITGRFAATETTEVSADWTMMSSRQVFIGVMGTG